MIHLRLLFVGLLGFAVGCADGAGPAVVGQATQSIVGPSNDDDHDRAAVLVEIATASGDTGSCSGVIIAPRAVLTAAHCVVPQAIGADATFSIFLGDDPRAPEQMALTENHVAVVTAIADPVFDLNLLQAGHDVAVLVTRASLSVAPLTFEPSPPLDDVESVRVVGFGITELNERSAGRRRDASIALASVDARFLELGGSDSAPCLGDSGGPVFVELADGTEALAGIVSFTDPRCGPFSRVSRLAAYESFLRDAIAQGDTPQVNEDTASGGCSVRAATGTHDTLPATWALLVLRAGARHRRRRARK